MNNFFGIKRHSNKKGFVFLLDIMLTAVLLVTFILTLLTFSTASSSTDSSQFVLTQSLAQTIDQSDLASRVVNSASTTELVAFLDAGIPKQYCSQVVVYTEGLAFSETANQTGCVFTTDKLTSAFRTIGVDNAVYLLEVYLWQN